MRPHLALFGREGLLTITTEALAAEPHAAMAGVYRWLGVNDTIRTPNLDERASETPDVVTQVRGSGALHRFRQSRLWNALGPLVPASVRGFGRRFSEKPVERRSVDPAAARRYLRPRQRPRAATIEELLDRRSRSGRRCTANPDTGLVATAAWAAGGGYGGRSPSAP